MVITNTDSNKKDAIHGSTASLILNAEKEPGTEKNTPSSPEAEAGGDTEVSPYRWIILVGLISAVIMEAVDTRSSMSPCRRWTATWELWQGNKAPDVNLHVLGDRNLLGGSLLGAALGAGLVEGLFIFPLFMQDVLCFTATETGLILLPAGLAILVGIVICGAAIQKGFDPRILIGMGTAIFVFANWELGHLSPQSDAHSTLAGYSTLKGEQIAQGTALWNLSPQFGGKFGGSLGIAALNTYFVNMTAYHRAILTSAVSSGNTSFVERQEGLPHPFLDTALARLRLTRRC